MLLKIYADFFSESASLLLRSNRDQLLWRDGSAYPEAVPSGVITFAHAWQQRLRQRVLASSLGVGLVSVVGIVATWILRRWIRVYRTRKIMDDGGRDLIAVETPFSKAVAVLQVVSQ